MTVRTLDALDARGRRVLLRADLDVPLDHGQIGDPTLLKRLCPTVEELCGRGARVILCGHLGQPGGTRVEALSLRRVATALELILGRSVSFVEATTGFVAWQAVEMLCNGSVLLLENTRFDPREEKNDPRMACELAALAEVYVNDAFASAHLAHASTEGVARRLPSYAGRLFQAELKALDTVLRHPRRPLLGVVGGAAVPPKFHLLLRLAEQVDTLALGGAVANTFLAATGSPIGRSAEQPGLHDAALAVLARAERAGHKVLLPSDVVVIDPMAPGTAPDVVTVDKVPARGVILDLGPGSIAALAEAVAWSSTVVWTGPLGTCDSPRFAEATTAIARAVARATRAGHLVSIAAGRDTAMALDRVGAAEHLSHVSTAVDAFLGRMQGRILPAIAALGGYLPSAPTPIPPADGEEMPKPPVLEQTLGLQSEIS